MTIIYALLGAFQNLPAWIRWVFIALSLAITLGLGAFFDTTVGIIVVLSLVGIGLLVGTFWAIRQKKREQQAAAFGGDLQQQSGTAPGSISDPARRARLEDLRRNFEKGVQTFRAAGKNLYDVPWYVIVGEPGAGKTEAIRHSNVGFPPGMQDEFQGVGGTINMNWWFTNDAVILDTAGRLLFEEVEPGTTGEWRVFLEMLKKHRVNCPINGLILAIPSESLIKDTPDQIQRKAGKIAQQLETIQKQLDVRFPAYVVVTKCDLLNGFREFFDDLTEQQAQQQMVGWSNPDPLDAPFRPELVDEHLYTVVDRLRRRRQGLLLDPVARNSERRADEVDRLYALPHSISLIGTNLSNYLKTIFTVGTWSERPLFLRGIYFTSSLREGSALDQELAEALGLPVDELPEGKAWERDRAYFLRDLFIEKAFRERGLVTRATNTKQLVLKRRLTFFGTGALGLITLLGLSWAGYHSLKNSIGNQSGYWARASEDWQDNLWKPVVVRESGSNFRYTGKDPVGPGTSDRTKLLFEDQNLAVDGFHLKLQELSEKPLDISLVFRPLSRFGVEIDRDRKRAQRVVYDGGVVKPLVDGSRAKMADTTLEAPSSASHRKEVDALVTLVRLEGAIVKRRENRQTSSFGGERFLPPLFKYTSGDTYEAQLPHALDISYADAKNAGAPWPPDWLSGGFTLADNRPIDVGLNRFIEDAKRAVQSRIEGLPLLMTLIEETRRYGRVENELYSAANTPGPAERVDPLVLNSFSQLTERKQAYDLALDQAKKAAVFGDGPVTLSAAYERLFGELRARYEAAKAMQEEANEILGATDGELPAKAGGEKKEHIIFREIRAKLLPVISEIESKFAGKLTDQEIAEMRTLDEVYMADPATNILRFQSRWALYETAVRASPAPNYASTLDLIGQDWHSLTDVLSRVDQIGKDVQSYNGLQRDKALTICKYCLDRARRVHSDEFCKAYLVQAKNKLRPVLRFPLVWVPMELENALKPDELVPAANLIERIGHDLESPTFQGIQSNQKAALADFRKRLDGVFPVLKGLLTPEKHLRLCTIVLLNKNDQFRLAGQQLATAVFKSIELRVGTIDHATPVVHGTAGKVPSESASDLELGKFTLFEPFHFHYYRNPTDSNIAVDQPAPNNWTSLRLLFELRGRRIGDGTKWQFSLQPAPDKLLWIEFRFDAPFPEFDDWPTRESLGVNVR